MAFTDYFAPIKRVGQQHRGAIATFGGSLGLLVAGELCLRRVLLSVATPSLAALELALLQPLGVVGMGLVLAAILVWALLVSRYQLSFFYPLWGLATLVLTLVYRIASGELPAPQTLFGALLVIIGAVLLIRGGHSI